MAAGFSLTATLGSKCAQRLPVSAYLLTAIDGLLYPQQLHGQVAAMALELPDTVGQAWTCSFCEGGRSGRKP